MIPNCEGCKYEFEEAYRLQLEGLYLDSTNDDIGIGKRKHFGLLIVNDRGKIVVW